MSKCKTINSTDDNIDSMDKLNHSDKITINKLEYVWDEALYCGQTALTGHVMAKHLFNIKDYCCIGEYSLNQDYDEPYSIIWLCTKCHNVISKTEI